MTCTTEGTRNIPERLAPWRIVSEPEKPKLCPFRIYAFAFSYMPKRLSFYFCTHITLSSAAGFKLYFCGILLRSKTTKMRLKTCPVERSGTVLQRLVKWSFTLRKTWAVRVKAFSSKAPTQISEARQTKKTITRYYAKTNLNETRASKKSKTNKTKKYRYR